MLTAVIALAGLGFLGSLGLAIAARLLAVETDPRVEEIEDALPGANCGACGSPGCAELAKMIAEGKADVDSCPVGGHEVAEKIAKIMGVDFSGSADRKVAIVLCAGNNEVALKKYNYNGIADCVSADMFFGGDKACSYGCLGLGTCVGACSFGAIDILPEGIAKVNNDKCTGCGECVEACPKGIIKLVPAKSKVHILCSSHDKGAAAKRNCKVACIGCQKCLKAAPEGAIQMDDFLAVINYGMEVPESVAAECPMGTIKVYDRESESKQLEGGA